MEVGAMMDRYRAILNTIDGEVVADMMIDDGLCRCADETRCEYRKRITELEGKLLKARNAYRKVLDPTEQLLPPLENE